MAAFRIMHVVCSDRFAGVERFVLRLASAQAGAGHEVTVAGGARDHMEPALAAAGVAFEPVVHAGAAYAAVRRRAREVDIVNTHLTAADGAAAAALAGVRDRPALVSTRHIAQRRGSHGPAAMYRAVDHRIDAEISVSRAVADAIGVSSTVVYTGLDAPALPAVPRRRVVLVAQRLQPEKRTDIAIRAFAAAGLAAGGWTLQIAGEGAERAALERLAGPGVEFLGFRADVPELMARSALLLAPCPVEGLGLTLLEAMASGLPALAADAAGHREVLAGTDTRARFAADDVAAATAALRTFAADPAARRELADQQGQRQREAFSTAAQVAGTDAVYRSAWERRRSR